MKTHGIFGIIGLIRFLFGTTPGRIVLVLFLIGMHTSEDSIIFEITANLAGTILLCAFFYSLYNTFFKW